MTARHYSNSKTLVLSFEYSWFLAKNLSNFYPCLENSTTGNAILAVSLKMEATQMEMLNLEQLISLAPVAPTAWSLNWPIAKIYYIKHEKKSTLHTNSDFYFLLT